MLLLQSQNALFVSLYAPSVANKYPRDRQSRPTPLPADVSRRQRRKRLVKAVRGMGEGDGDGDGDGGKEKLPHGKNSAATKLRQKRRRGGRGRGGFMHRLRDFPAANLIAFRRIPFASRERALARPAKYPLRERERDRDNVVMIYDDFTVPPRAGRSRLCFPSAESGRDRCCRDRSRDNGKSICPARTPLAIIPDASDGDVARHHRATRRRWMIAGAARNLLSYSFLSPSSSSSSSSSLSSSSPPPRRYFAGFMFAIQVAPA